MGEVFAGRFELIDVVTTDPDGQLWRAWDREAQCLCAAKEMPPSAAEPVRRLLGGYAAQLRHPHLLVPSACVETGDGRDESVLVVLPLMDGGSVADLVERVGPVPQRLAAEILRQLLTGLAALHRAGLAHGNVTPGTVLLAATGRGRPCVGLAGLGGEPTEATPATDLGSAGRVAAFMLSGAALEAGPAWVPPDGCSRSFAALVADLMAESPTAEPLSTLAVQARILRAGLGWSDDVVEADAVDLGSVLPPLPEPWRSRLAAGPVPGSPGRDADPENLAPDRPPGGVRTPAVISPERMAAQRGPVSSGSRGSDGAERPSVDPRGGRRLVSRLAWLAAGALVVGGAGVAWHVMTRPEPAGEPGGEPGSTASQNAPATKATSPPGAATPGATAPGQPATVAPSPATTLPGAAVPPGEPSGSAAPAGVIPTSGRIVVSVGQPCQSIEVGHRETTLDGMTVTCTLRPDETYAWLR